MRLCTFVRDGCQQVGVDTLNGLVALDSSHGADVGAFIAGTTSLADLKNIAATATTFIAPESVSFLPPVVNPPSFYCIGLNYVDHAKEANLPLPTHPTVFARYATSLCGHLAPIVRPQCSDSLDYEAELAIVIGKGGRHIKAANALEHVFGYSLFNDGSVREYQLRGQQWTLGKNFDSTGAFGPFVVTADELPPGAKGLRITTRLNDKVEQDGNTGDMVFDTVALIVALSEVMTLRPGDVIVTGTPAGVGCVRSPKLIMRHGDRCEVSIEGIGTLINFVEDERP